MAPIATASGVSYHEIRCPSLVALAAVEARRRYSIRPELVFEIAASPVKLGEANGAFSATLPSIFWNADRIESELDTVPAPLENPVSTLAMTGALVSVVALPELVTSPVRLALVVTLPAVRLAAVPVNPVPAPVKLVEDSAPVEGLKLSLVLVTFCGRLPVLEVTQVKFIAALVEVSSVIAVLVALVAVVAVVALPDSAAVMVPAAKLPELSRATRVLAVLAVATPVPVGRPLMTGVASVGEVPNTNAPLPVSSVTAVARLALDGVVSHVAMPVPSPVMLPIAGVIVALDTAVSRPLAS